MIIPTKLIIKTAAWLILAESVYALYFLKLFEPMATAGALASLFGVNSAHEHVQTYFSQQIDKGVSDQ